MNKPKVVRYGISDPYYPVMDKLKNGQYVKFKDYREIKTEIEKLRAENEWLKGNISGHIGAVDIFCERNDNLLAENAILREGLRWISVGTAEPTRFALAVLSDADKVRA